MLLKFGVDIQSQTKVIESGNQKIQYGHQAAILKVMSLKINRLLPMATINMHMKFEIEIPKETWLMLRKRCRLQTDGRTDGRTEGRTKWIQYTPPPTSLGGGIIKYHQIIDSKPKYCCKSGGRDSKSFSYFGTHWWVPFEFLGVHNAVHHDFGIRGEVENNDWKDHHLHTLISLEICGCYGKSMGELMAQRDIQMSSIKKADYRNSSGIVTIM